MNRETVCISGGTGFVGQALAWRLVRYGYRVRILARHSERQRALLAGPGVEIIQTSVHSTGQLQQGFAGCTAVINLVGILNETDRDNSFRQVHIELPRRICRAMQAAGVRRLLHMSALNADSCETGSHYLQTKGEGEDLVHAASDAGLIVTSFRPSVIFGRGDSFFNRFASLLRLSGPIFPLACPDSRFAPVYVGDVVEAFCRSIGAATAGERLDLCGPEVFTLRELVEYTRQLAAPGCRIIGLNDGLSRLQARILGLLPGKPFTLDNYHSLQKQSICVNNALPDLGIKPTPIDAVVPAYLCGATSRGRYPGLRRAARRS